MLDIHFLQCKMVLCHHFWGKAVHLWQKVRQPCQEEGCWYDAHVGFDTEFCQWCYRIWIELGEGMHYKEDNGLACIAEAHEESPVCP